MNDEKTIKAIARIVGKLTAWDSNEDAAKRIVGKMKELGWVEPKVISQIHLCTRCNYQNKDNPDICDHEGGEELESDGIHVFSCSAYERMS